MIASPVGVHSIQGRMAPSRTAARSVWPEGRGASSGANTPGPLPVDTVRLRQIAEHDGIGIEFPEGSVFRNQAVGLAFQRFAQDSYRLQGVRANSDRIDSPRRATVALDILGEAVPSVVPDMIANHYYPSVLGRYWRDSAFFEAKAVNGSIALSSSRYQGVGLIDVAALSPLGRGDAPLALVRPWPTVTFLTTSDTRIGPSLLAEATARRVEVRQAVAHEILENWLVLAPSKSLDGNLFTLALGITSFPNPPGLPGRLRRGSDTQNDPDPPRVEP